MVVLSTLLLVLNTADPSSATESQESPEESALDTWDESDSDAAKTEEPSLRRVLRLTSGADFLSLSVASEVGNQLELDYQPNSALTVGAQVGYGPFTVFGWINAGSLDDEVTFGKTRAFDLAAAWTQHLGDNELNLFAEYRRYKGFYLANTGDLFVGGSNDFPVVRGDIASTAATVSGTYFFSEDFSYARAFYDATPGRKSAGSWVVRVTTGFMGFSAAAPIVPPALAPAFGRSSLVSSSNALFIAASGGYAYDWVRESGFYLTGMILGGWSLGYRLQTEGEPNGFSDAPSASAAIATGWAGERFSGGLTGEGILDAIGLRDMDVGLQRIAVTLFFEIKL